AVPGVAAECSRQRYRMEAPHEFAGERIEGTDIAAGSLRLAVGNDRATNDHVLIDRRRRGHTIAPSEIALVVGIDHAFAEIQKSALAKTVDRLPLAGINRP